MEVKLIYDWVVAPHKFICVMTPDSKGTTNDTGFQYQSTEGKNKYHFYFPMSAEMWNILCDSYQSFRSILKTR